MTSCSSHEIALSSPLMKLILKIVYQDRHKLNYTKLKTFIIWHSFSFRHLVKMLQVYKQMKLS